MSLLKLFASPGSLSFLALGIAVSLTVAYGWPKRRRLGKRLLVALLALYVVMSLPVVAKSIAGRLPSTATTAAPFDQLIVLDGDNRIGRIQLAHEIVDARSPHRVWVLGAQWFADALRDAGIPHDRLVHETGASTTREQILRVTSLVESNPRTAFALIASRLQMPRIAALLQARGLSVGLIASPVDSEPPTSGARLFVPSYAALRVSRDAFYEVVALAYYRWRGWIPAS